MTHKEEVDKLDSIKLKNFCPWKDTVKRIKIKIQAMIKYLYIMYKIKDLYPEYMRLSKVGMSKDM